MTNNKAQVAIVQAKTYDDARVYEDIKRLVDLLGGINRFVKKAIRFCSNQTCFLLSRQRQGLQHTRQ